ncbi:MAG: HNH endonuclease [Candidatus Doudnabacteria bacterium]
MANKFYDSKEWAVIKNDLFMIRGKKCEICGSTVRINVHHLSYKNFGGNEEPEDLIVLCRLCHEKEHGIISNNDGLSKTARRKLYRQKRLREKRYRQSVAKAKNAKISENKVNSLKTKLIIRRVGSDDIIRK